MPRRLKKRYLVLTILIGALLWNTFRSNGLHDGWQNILVEIEKFQDAFCTDDGCSAENVNPDEAPLKSMDRLQEYVDKLPFDWARPKLFPIAKEIEIENGATVTLNWPGEDHGEPKKSRILVGSIVLQSESTLTLSPKIPKPGQDHCIQLGIDQSMRLAIDTAVPTTIELKCESVTDQKCVVAFGASSTGLLSGTGCG